MINFLIAAFIAFAPLKTKEPVANIPPGTTVILQSYSGYWFYPQPWDATYSQYVGLRMVSRGTDVIADGNGELFYLVRLTDRWQTFTLNWPANKVTIAPLGF